MKYKNNSIKGIDSFFDDMEFNHSLLSSQEEDIFNHLNIKKGIKRFYDPENETSADLKSKETLFNSDEIEDGRGSTSNLYELYRRAIVNIPKLSKEEHLIIAKDIQAYKEQLNDLVFKTPYSQDCFRNIILKNLNGGDPSYLFIYDVINSKGELKKEYLTSIMDFIHDTSNRNIRHVIDILREYSKKRVMSSYLSLLSSYSKDYDSYLKYQKISKKNKKTKNKNIEEQLNSLRENIRKFKKTTGVKKSKFKEHLNAVKSTYTNFINNRNKLTLQYLRLVINISKANLNRGIEFMDLIQEGNDGALEGSSRFDATKNFAITTCLTGWIKQRINCAVYNQRRQIRLPCYYHDLLNKIGKTYNKLSTNLGREATPTEIAAFLKIPVAKVHQAIIDSNCLYSLDSLLKHDDDSSLSDILEDTKSESPSMRVENNERINIIHMILSKYPKIKQDAVKLRFGVGYERNHTLEETGKILNLTRERVRQIIYKEILPDLKNPKNIEYNLLKSLWD